MLPSWVQHRNIEHEVNLLAALRWRAGEKHHGVLSARRDVEGDADGISLDLKGIAWIPSNLESSH